MRSHSWMHSRLATLLVSTSATVLFILMVGCSSGGGGGHVTPSTSTSVVLFPATATVPINGQIVFFAAVYNSTNTAVNFSTTGGATFVGNVLTVPGTPGPITVTATSQADSTKSATAMVTVTAVQPVSVNPAAIAIPAKGMQKFTASAGGQAVVWSLPAPPPGVDFGSIDQSGNYTAPQVPPPGGSVTISAASPAGAGFANVTILFSNASLLGQYAFSYSGEDSSGFLASAGSITFDGLGNVTPGGVEDVNSRGGVTMNAITGGTYQVEPDGRTTVAFTIAQATVTFRATMISAERGLLVRFDNVAAGSGTLDLQNKTELSVGAISNFYSFGISGINSGGLPIAIAGNFFADGNGNFPIRSAVQDVNDAGTLTLADLSLQGQIVTFDNNSGRGLLELTSTPESTLSFAFYIVDRNHFKLVETDKAPVLAGDAFSSPGSVTLNSFSGRNAFKVSGTVSNGSYVAGGILVSNGTGGLTGGIQDLNVAGSIHSQSIASSGSTYTIPQPNRILLNVANGNTTSIYGVYINTNGTAEMIELDTNVKVASGLAYFQSTTAAPEGSYGLNLTGPASKGEVDINGAIAAAAGGAFTGYLDANLSASVFPNLVLTGITTTSPSSLGRGLITLETAPPSASTFNLAYYAVDSQTYLIVELDSQRVLLGAMARQF